MASVLLVPQRAAHVGLGSYDGRGTCVVGVICQRRIRNVVVDRVYRVECSYYDFWCENREVLLSATGLYYARRVRR
ncbi:hypothetical protein D3C74_479480 [compost metagenome]